MVSLHSPPGLCVFCVHPEGTSMILTKMRKTIISDCIITMQVYGNFRFSVVQPLLSTGLRMLIIEKKNRYLCSDPSYMAIFQVSSCFKIKKNNKQAQKFLNNFQSLILTTLFAQ